MPDERMALAERAKLLYESLCSHEREKAELFDLDVQAVLTFVRTVIEDCAQEIDRVDTEGHPDMEDWSCDRNCVGGMMTAVRALKEDT